MKTASFFGHFFGFHLHGQQDHKTSAAVGAEHRPVLVFRGSPYHKEAIAAAPMMRTITGQACTFRGQRYLRTVAVVESAGPRVRRGIRVFRGSVVKD